MPSNAKILLILSPVLGESTTEAVVVLSEEIGSNLAEILAFTEGTTDF